MNFKAALALLTLGAIALLGIGCSDDDLPTGNSDDTMSEFEGYEDWEQVEYTIANSPLLGPAHAGNDDNAARTIYKRQTQARPDNDWGYPVGTMIVKVVTDAQDEVIGKTAMVKRGAGFDGANGDWEYFMWDVENDVIAQQGAIGMCIGCHSRATGANGADFVFAHEGDPFNN